MNLGQLVAACVRFSSTGGAIGLSVAVAALCFANVSPARGDDAPAQAATELTFENDVLPIFAIRCLKCHGDEVRKGGLDLRRRFTMEQGGDGGPALVPGKPEDSLFLEMIEKREMPPKDEDPLDARQIDLLKRWVASGAPLKGPAEAPLDESESDPGIRAEDRDFWSFRSPMRPAIPTVQGTDRVRTPIDSFLLSRLEAQGISFNSDAPRASILRRLCFDLHGLPPTAEQIDAWTADTAEGAYERLVDRLLESPRYGERWARHWLDVAGYSDSDGGLDADRERPEAWRYRDYVIRAFNDDKSYDRFVREQIAGDELSDWRRAEELSPAMVDELVATGFLRTAADPTYPGYKEKPEIYKVLADTMQIVGSTFLGVTIQCARCHEHKLEPISQRDYYQLTAVFAPALDPGRWLASIERGIPLANEARQAEVAAQNEAVQRRVGELNERLAGLRARLRREFVDDLFQALPKELSELDDDTRGKIRDALRADDGKRTEQQKTLLATRAASLKASDADVMKHAETRRPDLKAEADRIVAAHKAEQALVTTLPQVRGLLDLDEQAPETRLLRRGDFSTPGKAVEPGVPAVLAVGEFKFQPEPGYKSTGRRRAFAAWLTNPAHPTTARLQVNRVWAGHFGRGLVETLDDFGHTGKAPSHPELLDWLASEFVARDWSLKQLHRLIVTSTAYRQSSAFDSAKAAIDSENTLLWAYPPQRQQGETLRDSVLTVAGKLNLQMFGAPVAVARQQDGSVVTADDANGNRRSIYLQVRRSQPVTLMEAFDTPKMEVNCTRRTEAIVATQALTLLNSPFIESGARAAAERIAAGAPDRHARITLAWRLFFGRDPTDTDRASAERFLDQFVSLQLGDTAAATTEARAAAETAAWPHLALILMNTNEFLYID